MRIKSTFKGLGHLTISEMCHVEEQEHLFGPSFLLSNNSQDFESPCLVHCSSGWWCPIIMFSIHFWAAYLPQNLPKIIKEKPDRKLSYSFIKNKQTNKPSRKQNYNLKEFNISHSVFQSFFLGNFCMYWLFWLIP